MNDIFKFLKCKMSYIAVVAMMIFVFMISFALYHLPMEAVIYPTFIAILVSVIFLIAKYTKEKKKNKELKEVIKNVDFVDDILPEAESISDENYNEIIRLLIQKERHISEKSTEKYSDMIEYYTTWVHQIKTPIAAMRLKIQAEDSDFSRRVGRELTRIEQYVEMVLTFLRLDSSDSDYVIREYELDRLLKDSIKKYSGEFIDRKIRLDFKPSGAKILTDEKWFSFVIEQIISNALKYTNEGQVSVFCAADKLFIKDTGMGIAPEDLPRIFERGYTGFNGRVDKKASGIGLYLCKRICKKLGHEISAESERGKGTTIIIDVAKKKLGVE